MTNLPFSGKFRVTNPYKAKGNYAAGFHTGIDLVGDTDKTIYSVCDGKVIMAKNYGEYGNTIKIKDSNTGKIFLFAHLSRFYVKVGQTVSRLTRIGYMGNTGNSRGAHLHIEMRTAEDKYGEIEDITKYMGIPNKEGSYNSVDFQINTKPSIKYEVHVQNEGWQEQKVDGQLAGTEGKGLRVEAIKIHADKPIKYRVHIQDIGWTEYVPNDVIAGTVGESKRIEAIEIVTDGTPIRARAHIQNIGWEEVKEGSIIMIGTVGRALRLEALTLEYV